MGGGTASASKIKKLTGNFRRFVAMESAANRLQKEAKGYLDSLRGQALLMA